MLDRLKYKVGSLSMRVKLTALFLAISIIPACIVGVLSHQTAKMAIIEHAISEMQLRVNTIEHDLQQYMVANIDYTSARIATHAGVRRLLGETGAGYTAAAKEYDRSALNDILLDNVYRQGTDSILVIGEDGQVYSNAPAGGSSLPLPHSEKEAFMSTSINVTTGSLVKINGLYCLPYIRKIHYKTTKIVGYAVVNIALSALDSLYYMMPREPRSEIYVFDDNNVVVSSSIQGAIGRSLDAALSAENRLADQGSVRIDGEHYIYCAKLNGRFGWTVCALQKQSAVVAEARPIALITIQSAVFSFVLCIFLAILLSLTITRPVQKLIDDMERFESGTGGIKFVAKYDDEIGRLGKSFAKMTDKLNKSFEDIYSIEAAKQEAEFKSFEAQINPHFLYNTFSTIVALIESNRGGEAIEVIQLLSTMFRDLMGRGTKSKITIMQEFDHVISYVNIQLKRYHGQFICIYQVDEILLPHYTVRLILQPLVENAIYHGIKNMDRGGIIKFIGYIADGDVVLEVWDNGKGADAPKISAMNASLHNPARNEEYGIGIRNVHNRIRYVYGNPYGLDFRLEGGFTVARIRLPADKGGSA